MRLVQVCPRIVDVLEDLCGENHVHGAVTRIDPPLSVDEPVDLRRTRKVNTQIRGAASGDKRLVRAVATTEVEHSCPGLNMIVDRFGEGVTKAGEHAVPARRPGGV
jgi:hypothetical protein